MRGRTRVILRAICWLGSPALAVASPPVRVALGQYGEWGAFRDAAPPRCFAIARAIASPRAPAAALAVSSWPRLRARDQIHVRLSRAAADVALLEVGALRVVLLTHGADAWAANARDDARIALAMRAGGLLQVRATDRHGRRFRDRYDLEHAASAIDAMRLGCLLT